MPGFWETLVVAKRSISELDRLVAEAAGSMRETEERTREAIVESRELMRQVDALLSRDRWAQPGDSGVAPADHPIRLDRIRQARS